MYHLSFTRNSLICCEYQILLVMAVFAHPIALCMKVSLLLLYLRIFGVERKLRYILYFFVAVTAFFYLGSTGVAIALIYLSTLKDGRRRSLWTNNYKLVVAQAVFAMVTDFLVLGIPVTRV